MICLTYPNIWRSFVCGSRSEGSRAIIMCIIMTLWWGGFAIVCGWIYDDDNMCRRRRDGVLMRLMRCVLVECGLDLGRKVYVFFFLQIRKFNLNGADVDTERDVGRDWAPKSMCTEANYSRVKCQVL